MFATQRRLMALFSFCLLLWGTVLSFAAGAAEELAALAANRWTLLDSEDASGGKMFASAIWAENVKRVHLWGTGGEKPARNVYLRYELESLDPRRPGWQPALPDSRAGKWTAEKYPPFRIYGQSGPDGLHYDEGPRLQVVGGYHSTNRIRWWDFDGVKRPSPIHTFNMACWDTKRQRILYYSDGFTFSLDPRTNTWTDLQPGHHPTTCRSVAWASLCYDPVGDRVMLFGGGLATNPRGAAPTWFYDCAENKWRRPALEVEPPPRCNGPLSYDAASRSIVLFGGYNQAAALNDTWIYDCEANRWQQRRPQPSPPPMTAPAAAPIPGQGKVLVCGNDARRVRRSHFSSSSANKETWVYDVQQDTWTPIDADLKLPGYRWLTATAVDEPGVVLLVAFGPQRRTYALRYDAAAAKSPRTELPGAPPATVAWKYPEQKDSLAEAPAPDVEAHRKRLEQLPANRFIDAQPPGLLISKTWSTAVIDTDRSEVIYTGGGHSGYSGNDVARYSVAENRWRLDFPPRFPPFLEGTNAGIFAWSYGMIPFSQHTYLWYCYDPVSKCVVYLARPSIPDGTEVQLTENRKVFTYSSKQHGYASWVYDSAAKKMHPPSFGRPFDNPWHLSVVGTPQGVFAVCREELFRGVVARETGHVDWQAVDGDYPAPRDQIKYHYEFQPLVHDTKRNRLIQLKGDADRVDVFTRPLSSEGDWQQMETTGKAAIGREAVYIPRHDVVLWLGERLFVLDLTHRRMSQVEVELPDGLYTHECALVYDPRHNVCVALIPKSFSGPMQTFLFRYEP